MVKGVTLTLSQRDTFRHQLSLALRSTIPPCNIPDSLNPNDFVSGKINKYWWILDNQTTCRSTTTADADPSESTVTLESSVEQAKRAFALKKYEEAIDHYATALELV